MATGDEMNGGVPTPPTAAPPPPPMGAMNKGVTGADPTNTAAPTAPAASPSDPENQLMAEATRLGGPLGGIAMGAATGAAHHTEQQNQPQSDPNATVYYKLSSGRVASLPTASVHTLMQQDAGAKPLPSPKDGEALVQLSDGRVATVPHGSLDALNQQDPDANVIAGMGARTGAISKLLSQTAGIDTPSTDENEYSDPATGMTLSQMADPRTLKMAATTAGAEIGGLAALPVSAAVGGGYLGAAAEGAMAGGVQKAIENPIEQVAEGQNPFRGQMLAQTAARTAEGAGFGAAGNVLLHGAGDVVGGAFNKAKQMAIPGAAERPNIILPSEVEQAGNLGPVTEAHFQEVPKTEIPQNFPHGKPVVGDQPLSNAVIAGMRQGRSLGTDEANLLREYVGDVVPNGSTPMNTAMGAVKHVNQSIRDTEQAMQDIITKAPEFDQSIVDSEMLHPGPGVPTPPRSEIGNSLLEDLHTIKENLPLGASDPMAEAITNRTAAATEALRTRNPQELLNFRRDLGKGIDWANLQDIAKAPKTTQDVKQIADARIYQAITDKLKTIPGLAKLDEVFQPNLELRSWLDKVLPEGVAFDPTEAEAQRVGELAKGLRKNAIDAHNERISANVKLAEKAVAAHKERVASNWKKAAAVGGLIYGGKQVVDLLSHATPPPTIEP